jgi:hypothetical protein
VSLSTSYDTSRGVAEGADPALNGGQQLSQWSVRLALVNHRNPIGLRYSEIWNSVGLVAGQFSAAIDGTRAAMTGAGGTSDSALGAWMDALAADLAKVDDRTVDKLEAVIERHLRKVPELGIALTTQTVFQSVERALDGLDRARASALDRIAKGALLTVEFANDRPADQPRENTGRLSFEVGGSVDLTANAAMTWFEKTPPVGRPRIKSMTAAAQIDMPHTTPQGTFVVSLSGRYERLNGDAPAGLGATGINGNLQTYQLKVTLPMKDGATKIPFSLTWASRSETIKERVVRFHVGVTYDLNTILAQLKP